jgi:hypothetical protein
MAMGLLPSFALITYESRRWLGQHIPSASKLLPAGDVARVAALRHAAKWINGSKGGLAAGLDIFRQMRTQHEEEFLGNTPYVWARPLESNLGLYRLGGVDVLNTHLLGLALGGEPPAALGPLLERVSETMVRQARLINNADVLGPSFLDDIGPVAKIDVRSDQYYRESGGDDLAVVGYLHVLWCSLAFLQVLQVVDPEDEGPIFKLKFAGFMHVVQSLEKLEPQLLVGMDAIAVGHQARRLRNDLVHYTPHDATPAAVMDPFRPRRGIVQHAYGMGITEVSRRLSDAIDRLHSKLSAFLGRQ